VRAGGGVLTTRPVAGDGTVTVLRDGLESLPGEVVDATVMRAAALDEFLAEQVAAAKQEGLLFSVHLKATMMKVSDPIIFGHVVRAFIGPVLERHGDALAAAGLSPDEGLGAILAGLGSLPDGEEIRSGIEAALAEGPALAMVDSGRGITNLHVPSDVIVDASMPAMIRNSGRMWGPDGAEADTLAVLPDSSYSGVYQAVIDDCRTHGAYDPRTMGTVPNVGLMAQQAEEYGSHDKTFHIERDGRVEVVNSAGDVLMRHDVAAGDIWRACQTKDAAIRDWVGLAVTRARATGWPAVFWLDETRAHDRNLLLKVKTYLAEHEIDDLDIRVLPPVEATRFTVERIRRGENTISVTGNVLRDYLTDLFPILELGTSAKMLSIVPLMAGGGLFETGAGGSAPKHVQQLLAENYLRWDSLGEFLALAASLEHFASTGNARAGVLASTLDRANGRYLTEDKSPTRRLGGTVRAERSREGLRRLDLQAALGDTLPHALNEAEYRRYTRLPEGNPQTRRLAETLAKQSPDERAFIRNVLNHFSRRHFSYTLRPPTTAGRNGIDEFMFATRQGFCEHYAQSFAVIMRAAGLPARIVTGYQGAEYNPQGGFWQIRAKDAHAWTEVWLPSEQVWLRVDPTAAVAAVRTEQGIGSALPQNDRVLIADESAFSRWRDAGQFYWQQWVVNYDQSRQNSFFSLLGLGGFNLKTLLLFLPAALAAALLPLYRWQAKNRSRDHLEEGFMLLKLALLGDGGESAPSVTAAELKSLLHENGIQDGALETLLADYDNLRYAGLPSDLRAERRWYRAAVKTARRYRKK